MQDSLHADRLFCFGLGFSAMALAERLLLKGWQVSGTCRDIDSQNLINAKNISVFLFDGSQATPEISQAISRATHLLVTIPPQPSGDVVLENFGEEISRARHLKWIGYISSTGVYGDSQGEWVDENSPLRGSTELNRRRIEVESAWLKRRQGLPVMIFRCVGIYGPGRNLLVSVKKGRARRIGKPGLVFSRIHVVDLAQTLEASINKPQSGEIYNVSDDCPCPPAEAVEYACDLLGVEPPPLVPYEEADLSPTARGFYNTNKRISNQKIKEVLGVKLRYSDYRSGLKALLADL